MAHNPSSSFEMLRLSPGLSSDPASGRTGEVYYNSTTNSLKYFDGSLWQNFGGTWANQQLSNLVGPTSIGVDLLPAATLSQNIGSGSLVWSAANVSSLMSVANISDVAGVGVQITSNNTTGATNSGALTIQTGTSVNGNSGGVLIRTGAPSGGTTVFEQQVTSFASTVFNFTTTALGTNLVGVSFVAPANGVLNSIDFKLQNATGTADTYSAQVSVYADSSGAPGPLLVQSPILSIPIAGSTTIDQLFTFNNPVSVTSGQTYYFILSAQSVASTLNLLGSSAAVSPNNLTESTNSGTSWSTTTSPVPYFILYNSPNRGTIDLDGNITRLMNQSTLEFMNSGSTKFVGFKAPASIANNVTWILPNADGGSGNSLVTDGAGNLSWAPATSGLYVLKTGDTMTGTLNLPNINVNSGQFQWASTSTMSLLGVLHVQNIASTSFPGYISFTHGAVQAYVGIDDVGLANLSPGNLILMGGSTSAGVTMIANSLVKMTVAPTITTTYQDIVPNAAASLNIGSNSLWYLTVAAEQVTRQAQLLVGAGGTTLPSGASGGYGLNDLNIGNLGTMAIWSNSNNAATSSPTGTVRIESGNKSAGTGNSGDIKIRIGTSSGGTRGSLYIADGSEGTVGYVWTSTDTTGKGHWAPGGASAGTTPHVEYRTLTSGEASANQLTLAATPATAANTLLDIIAGDSQVYGSDYSVSGAIFSWASGPLAGTLSAGDILRIVYWT